MPASLHVIPEEHFLMLVSLTLTLFGVARLFRVFHVFCFFVSGLPGFGRDLI